MKYKVVPIPENIVKQVRSTLLSPQYKHPASVSVATGYGPCRSCLKTFEEGKDERILFTYNSFESLSDLPQPAPVFIHNEECSGFSSTGFPPDIVDLPVLFEGFGQHSSLIVRQKLDKQRTDEQISEILALPGVEFINIRNAEAGCFIARIDRDIEAR